QSSRVLWTYDVCQALTPKASASHAFGLAEQSAHDDCIQCTPSSPPSTANRPRSRLELQLAFRLTHSLVQTIAVPYTLRSLRGMSATIDPFRVLVSNFGSGLEHLWEVLWYEHGPGTRKKAMILSVHCLVIQTTINAISLLSPSCFRTFHQLFYPTVLLYRYLRPEPWDELFMRTVRSLGCLKRSDVAAKPSPEYFSQLRRHVHRSLRTFLEINVAFSLMYREGYFPLLRVIAGVIAASHILESKGFKHAFWKLLFTSFIIGPRWSVWGVQTLVLQRLLMYELLQPYLARVQFKDWEERAWLSQFEIELQGFAFGAWCLCSIPWVGVAALPLMFPAVAILLTRSCGSLENTGQRLGGDMMERMAPGSKDVALGQSKSVGGDWNEAKVKTHVRSIDASVFKAKEHTRGESTHYIVLQGTEKPVTEDQIQADKARLLYHKRELEMTRNKDRPTRMQPIVIQNHPVFGISSMEQNFYPDVNHSTARNLDPTRVAADIMGNRNSSVQEAFTMYNLGDQEALDTPSAPLNPSRNPNTIFSSMGVSRHEADFQEIVPSDLEQPSTDDQETNSTMSWAENKRQMMENKRQMMEDKRQMRRNAKEYGRVMKNAMRAHKESFGGKKSNTLRSRKGLEDEARENRLAEVMDEEEEGDSNIESEGSYGHGFGRHELIGRFRGLERGRGWRGWRGSRGGWPFTRGISRGYGYHREEPRSSTAYEFRSDSDTTYRSSTFEDVSSLPSIIAEGVQNVDSYISHQVEELKQRLSRLFEGLRSESEDLKVR
ncbi:hypothetical protein BGZ65_012510, partial [Modicella reniformis]